MCDRPDGVSASLPVDRIVLLLVCCALWNVGRLVTITFLQHTHPNLPHYEDEEWDWIRGALATVDRSYGFLDILFHHIADTHVAHHLFSQMPHYHAQVGGGRSTCCNHRAQCILFSGCMPCLLAAHCSQHL